MKKLTVKIASAMLAATMALSFAACNNNGGKGLFNGGNSSSGSGKDKTRSGQKISADTPWFDSKLIDVNIPVDDSRDIEYTYPRLAGVDDKYIVAFLSGYYKMPDGNNIDWDNFNYNDYSINIIGVLDRNTNTVVNTIDLTKDMPKNGYIDNATYDDGKITVKMTNYDDLTFNMSSIETDIDPLTGNELAKREISYDENDYGGAERTFKVGNYKLLANEVGNMETTNPRLVISEMKKLLDEYNKKDNHTFIPTICPSSSTTQFMVLLKSKTASLPS